MTQRLHDRHGTGETRQQDAESGPVLRPWLQRTRSDLVFFALSVVVGAALLFSFLADVYVAPLGFDEAYVLQAPVNLLTGSGYATTNWAEGGNVVPFDPLLSTGPAVLLPAAASMALFGISIEAARWATLPFLLLLIASAAVVGRRVSGRWGALAALAGLLAINSASDYPATVVFGFADAIGEFPSSALILLAIVLVSRSRFWSGVALGVAITTKLLALLALPALLLAALLLVPFAKHGSWWSGGARRVVALLGGATIPIVLWELVKLVTLGWDGYLRLTISYFDVVLSNGSGADGGGGRLRERIGVLIDGFFGSPWLVVAAGTVVVGLVIVWIVGSFRPSRSWQFLTADRDRLTALVGALGTLAVFAAWWMLISDRTWFRHVLPGIVVGVPALTAAAVLGVRMLMDSGERFRSLKRALAVTGGAVAVIAVAVANVAMGVVSPFSWSRAEQLADAAALRKAGVEQVQHFLGWQNPELLFLDQEIETAPYKEGRGPILLSPMMKNDAYGYEVFQGQCVSVIYQREDTLLCVPVINP